MEHNQKINSTMHYWSYGTILHVYLAVFVLLSNTGNINRYDTLADVKFRKKFAPWR